jgi:mRNA-degrading endonuclease toxin of MazEF toxin-antitoxin module
VTGIKPGSRGVARVILADHVKSLDWKAHKAERIGPLPQPILNEVLARLAPLLGY